MMDVNERVLNDIILSIYDAAIDPELWPAVLDRCVQVSGALSCTVFEWSEALKPVPFLISHSNGGFSRQKLFDYNASNVEQERSDRIAAKANLSRYDQIEAISDEILYDDYEELLARPNVRSLKEFGQRHRVIAFLNKDNLDFGQFTLQYRDGRGPATGQELANLNFLLPHLAKALDLGRVSAQLTASQKQMLAAMDRLTLGICLLDEQGRIVQENQEFKRQRDRYEAFHKAANGVLVFNEPAVQKRFDSLKANVRNHGRFGARPRKEVVSRYDDEALCVELVHLSRSEEIGSAVFGGYVLFSNDTSRPVLIDPDPVNTAFGLTDAETALVQQIADGLTNAQIAERHGKSVHTISNQIKSILTKTNCITRTQFVRLLMSYGMQLVDRPETPTTDKTS